MNIKLHYSQMAEHLIYNAKQQLAPPPPQKKNRLCVNVKTK